MKAQMMKLLLCICSIVTIIAMVGCEATTTSSSIENSKVTSTTETSKANDDIATKVFPKDKIIDVKITIDKDDFQSMMDNASAEEIKTASVDYNGMHYDNVGVRTKGNLSLRSVVSMDDSDRYSLKLSFDEYLSSQTILGISKINLNNGYSDASYMREYLTYELAEQMGLPTPGYSFVNVYVNDELYGFYLAVQQVDEQYLESNFGNSYGALYKGEMTGTGSDLLWIDDKVSSYTGLAQKSKTSNDDILIDMLDELNHGTDYAKYLDVEESLKYVALNVLTNNTDSYIGGNKQNYYLYEDDGVFSVLPWDYNMAFGGLGSSTLLIDEPTQGTLAERPLVAKLLAVDEYKEMYHNIIKDATEGYLSSATFKERVEEVSAMISPYVKEDPSSFYTYEEYQSAVPKLISINDTQVSSIDQQLAGTIASSGDGSGSGGGKGGGMRGGGGRDLPAMAGNNTQATPTEVNAQAGELAPTDGQNAQGAPTAPTDGQNFQGGGFPGGDMGGDRPDGMGGGRGGMGGGIGGFGEQSIQPQGSVKEAVTVGITLIVLLLSGLFVTFYKRKRL
ncbi:CotH kinase family protein [Paenibacillus macquariensis]|uniref:CotH protein n=1 Tax=Paenibacillus macquariensis TaxID=948756 RepID=A0ABY1JWQ8_9BACL|nr:CotH kinase family protein [Paenibacillus macquariensis]MEC0089431.1 CotH kinase family protein [Paenibacillus macquariensis]OAB33184.1 spore coat protein CotH [Paenibacillus macquariensis subsp. macquariensis]SIQ91474.1 CotH protein [Paenibacillus macquariensis]